MHIMLVSITQTDTVLAFYQSESHMAFVDWGGGGGGGGGGVFGGQSEPGSFWRRCMSFVELV